MKFVELFAGAGGMACGLKQAGHDPICAVEIDPDAAETYRRNIGNHVWERDVREVVQHLPEADLLVGGPPCQGFSTAGAKRADDPRNQLFQAFLDAIDVVYPYVIIFENVPGFANMYGGAAKDALLKGLDDRDYVTQYSVLDCTRFGIPQTRKRFIALAWHKDAYRSYMLPQGDYYPPMTLWEAIGDLQGTKMRCAKHSEKYKRMISHIPQGSTIYDLPIELVPDRPKGFPTSFGRLRPDAPANTITRNFSNPGSGPCIHPYEDRGLSIEEAMRIQTFPDNYDFAGSLTSIRKQIGNAVPPKLALALGEALV